MIDIQIECIASIESIHYFNQLCERALDLMDCKEKQSVAFALNEAIINAVEATHKKFGIHTAETVIVQMKISLDIVDIQVMDKAGGMSEEQIEIVMNKEFEDIGFADRGRGIIFMRKLMDQVYFERKDKDVFIVRLMKAL